jgi:maltose O-acetyltransferase
MSALLRFVNDSRPLAVRIGRGIGALRAAVLLRKCRRGARVYAQGRVRVVAEGSIVLGGRVQLFGGKLPTELIAGPGAELVVGEGTMFNHSVSLEARRSIRIGRRCRFGAMVCVRDFNDFTIEPVAIGDDVWLAHGVIVEPGVHIGEGAVVSAGSVVTSDVPPRTLAAGNPASHFPLECNAREGERGTEGLLESAHSALA